jgi:uncharacterized phage protein gp47/JayE
MPAARPTLEQLITRVQGDITSRNEGRPFLKRAAERIFGYVVAGVAHSLWGYLEWTGKQLFPTEAELEGLLRWGTAREVPYKLGVAASGGAIELTGKAGTVVDAGTLFRAPNDALVQTRAAVTLGAGPTEVEVLAQLPGVDGNLALGTELSIVTSIKNLDDVAVLTTALSGGSTREDVELYRGRIMDDLRSPRRNGAPGDYRQWALEREGVTRAWEQPHRMGVGTVSVAFVLDGRDNIIPTPSDVADMQAYLDSKKPVDMRAVYVIAPVPKPVDITVSLSPATLEVDAAVREELASLFTNEAELEEPIALSVVDETISGAPGESSHNILAVSSLMPGPWEILTLGTITTGI